MILDLDENDLRVINAALFEFPYKLTAPLIYKINEQLKGYEPQTGTEQKPEQEVQVE